MVQRRSTRQGQIIDDVISRMSGFYSAEEVHAEAQKKEQGIGIATIYRKLKKSVEEGKIFSYKCDRRTVYSTKKQSHCHFVCEKTGKIIHFDVDTIDFLKSKIPGSITSFQIEVRGICKDC